MKKFVASITQSGSGAPAFFTVHHNTLGGTPTIARLAPGEYQIEGGDLFPTGRFVAWLAVPCDDNEGWVNQVHPSDTLLNLLTYNAATLADECMASGQCLFVEVY